MPKRLFQRETTDGSSRAVRVEEKGYKPLPKNWQRPKMPPAQPRPTNSPANTGQSGNAQQNRP